MGGEEMSAEAVERELFTNRFTAIATDMGCLLQRTAVSTNIKERQDFSCAVLDGHGSLVVNAPHIPVHLGALGLCVRRLLERHELAPGDMLVTNHPEFGGSHLPDISLVSAVYTEGSTPLLLGFVASRAHHAEIGGSRPGSMPPDARSLAEEGVVIPPTLLCHGGDTTWSELRRVLEDAPYPSRAVEENLADIAAALAANRLGVAALQRLAVEHGPEVIKHYMCSLRSQAAVMMTEALRRLGECRLTATERMDDGSRLSVSIDIAEGRARFDFSGSADTHAGNLNATAAIVHSVVLYVLRLLVDHPLPLNEGLLEPVELVIPRGMLNPDFSRDPQHSPAIVGGNMETSQRLVDTLLKAFGLAACSQGTMNNVIFGNEHYGYYETVAGGCGAGPGFHGACAVHTHMTNTRITDPEVLEHRYPVRVERFAVRQGSGGTGQYHGGDGVVRELRFLERAQLSVVTQHRQYPPYGVNGGSPGAVGRQRVLRRSGEVVELGSVDGCEVFPGDRLVLETPGGGGWGRSAED